MSSTSISRKRSRWWKVIAYEVDMFRGMTSIPANHPIRGNELFRNSISENIVLHTRNLCDFGTSERADDIKPSDLFDGYATDDPRYALLQRAMRRLRKRYGEGGKGSARWAFNKKFAHPTKGRSARFDYTRYINRVRPVLESIIAEMERLRGRPL